MTAVAKSTLDIVDLAGVEQLNSYSNKVQKESSNINKRYVFSRLISSRFFLLSIELIHLLQKPAKFLKGDERAR